MASDNPSSKDEPKHVGIVFTYDRPSGIPMVHIAKISRDEHITTKNDCLPELVKVYCGEQRRCEDSELVKVDYGSIMCHPCALAVPEHYWDCLPKPYRDPLFRMQMSKSANNDTDKYATSMQLYRRSTIHQDWGDRHYFGGSALGKNHPSN